MCRVSDGCDNFTAESWFAVEVVEVVLFMRWAVRNPLKVLAQYGISLGHNRQVEKVGELK